MYYFTMTIEWIKLKFSFTYGVATSSLFCNFCSFTLEFRGHMLKPVVELSDSLTKVPIKIFKAEDSRVFCTTTFIQFVCFSASQIVIYLPHHHPKHQHLYLVVLILSTNLIAARTVAATPSIQGVIQYNLQQVQPILFLWFWQ